MKLTARFEACVGYDEKTREGREKLATAFGMLLIMTVLPALRPAQSLHSESQHRGRHVAHCLRFSKPACETMLYRRARRAMFLLRQFLNCVLSF
jgi:hypothetical protein